MIAVPSNALPFVVQRRDTAAMSQVRSHPILHDDSRVRAEVGLMGITMD